MDANPLRNLFARREDLPADLAAALADLDRLGRESAALAAPSRSLSAVLRAAFLPPSDDGLRYSSRSGVHGWRVLEAAGAGTPYFRVEPPEPDLPALSDRLRAIGSAHRAAGPFSAWAARRPEDLGRWVTAFLAGSIDDFPEEVRGRGFDQDLAASVLRLALLPSLAPCSAAIDPFRPADRWGRGDCPNCGSAPLLAESRGIEGRRFARCGLCASEWPIDRMRCISCGEADPRALRSLSVEGQEARQRLVRCASCRHDLIVVTSLAPLSAPGLLVAELATLPLRLIGPDDGVT